MPAELVYTYFRPKNLESNRLAHELRQQPHHQSATEHFSRFRNRWMREMRDLKITYRDTLEMAQALGDDAAIRRLLQLKQYEGLERLHQNLSERYNEQREALLEREVYHQPPVQGSETIIPITNSVMLLREGRAMHHCVASYRERILRGACYIYQVTVPERATLEIILHQNRPRIGQLRLKYNREPAQQTFDAVKQWLNDNGMG